MRPRSRFTFHSYLSHSLYNPEGWHGHTGVVGWLPDVCKLQDVSSNGHVVLRREVLSTQHPLDIWHGRAHCHTCYVDAAAWHDLIVCRWNGESRWHPAYCKRSNICQKASRKLIDWLFSREKKISSNASKANSTFLQSYSRKMKSVFRKQIKKILTTFDLRLEWWMG